MHYTARNLTIFACFLMVINVLTGTVAFLHLYISLEDTGYNRPVICIFLLTAIALFIVTPIILWNLHKDTVYDSQESLNKNEALNKKIKDLEKEISSLKYQISAK